MLFFFNGISDKNDENKAQGSYRWAVMTKWAFGWIWLSVAAAVWLSVTPSDTQRGWGGYSETDVNRVSAPNKTPGVVFFFLFFLLACTRMHACTHSISRLRSQSAAGDGNAVGVALHNWSAGAGWRVEWSLERKDERKVGNKRRDAVLIRATFY